MSLGARVGRVAYRAARSFPAPMLQRLQRAAANNSRTSRLLKRVSGRISGGPQTIGSGPAEGMVIDVAGSRPSYILGTAEPEVRDFLASHLKPGGSFYDLGANIGYFTLVGASLVGPAGAVRSYEPFPANLAALRRNVELNALSNVVIVPAAVADRAGEARFEVGPTDQDGRIGEGDLVVRTVSIDDELASGAPPPTVVKIDVEGAEGKVLEGMSATLRDRRPIVLCELHEDPFDLDAHPVARALAAHGYELAWLTDEPGLWAPHLVGLPSD